MIKKTLFHKIMFYQASTVNTSVTKRDLRILGETSTGRDPGFLYVRTSIKKLLNGRPDVQKPWFAVATALFKYFVKVLKYQRVAIMFH